MPARRFLSPRRLLAFAGLAAVLLLAFVGYRSLVAPAHLVITDSAVPQQMRAGGLLVQERYCMRCHEMTGTRIGPGFVQIAERYRGDAGAPQRLAGKIQHGSTGTWGRKVMPRQLGISPEQAQAMAAWVLGQGETR